ncbi:MAG: GNAT family N-acetyltransferase [Anaerolineae bacterium]|nr:GNAT family N-acetyltransferase [Anaerolineae bacterium]
MRYRHATPNDCPLLAQLNHQLIRDEGHRNPMTVPELEGRMRGWLGTDYQAIIFEEDGAVVAYALYRNDGAEIYLRQFFVVRHRRREGIGRRAMQILLNDIWPQNRRRLVEALWSNSRAIQFWKAAGFREYCLTLEILPRKSNEKSARF